LNLVEAYESIKPSIVAFAPKFYTGNEPPKFPHIFGTGFIVSEGLVVTNDHVIRIFPRLPSPPNFQEDQWAVDCIMFYYIPDKGMAMFKMDVIGIFGINKAKHPDNYMGPDKPDIAFVHIKMKNLPKVNVKYDLRHIKEGREISTAGFPMGTETLMAPGYLHQLTPTLQSGVISAVLPFSCKAPHAIMINIMVQGGASGSPVFLPETGDVIGVLYGGLEEDRMTSSKLPYRMYKDIVHLEPSIHEHRIKIPTNISYVVPANIIEKTLEQIISNDNYVFPDDTPILEGFIQSADIEIIGSKEGIQFGLWGSEEENIKLIEPKVKPIDNKNK